MILILHPIVNVLSEKSNTLLLTTLSILIKKSDVTDPFEKFQVYSPSLGVDVTSEE
jgi:hypothetical protein